MAVTITEIEKQDVITLLGNNDRLVICDFKTYRMMACNNMTLQAIGSFVENPYARFFKVVDTE